jgi:Tfp pilus assembly protein FimT
MTAVEILIVVAVAAIVVTMNAVSAAPWIGRESMRGALNDAFSYLQLAKIESVSRNRDCRFVVDTAGGRFEVWDTAGTDSIGDDVRLHVRKVPSGVAFGRPEIGEVVTLEQVGGSITRYQTVFTSDGMVRSGTGEVFLRGGGGYGRVDVYPAGGTQIRRWSGSDWRVGS